jgi:hypothetical protein
MPLLKSDGCKYLKHKVKVVGKTLALPIIKEKLWLTSYEMVMSWKLSAKMTSYGAEQNMQKLFLM